MYEAFPGQLLDEEMSALSHHNCIYIEASTGFSHILVVSTTHSSLKAASLKWPLVWKWWVEGTFQGRGMWGGDSHCPGPAWGSTIGHILWMTSSHIKWFLSKLHLSIYKTRARIFLAKLLWATKEIMRKKVFCKLRRPVATLLPGSVSENLHFSSNLCFDIWLILGASSPFRGNKSCTTQN